MSFAKPVKRFGKAYIVVLAVCIAIPLLFISGMVLFGLPLVLYSLETGTDVFDPAEVPLWILVVEIAWQVGILALIGTVFMNPSTESESNE